MANDCGCRRPSAQDSPLSTANPVFAFALTVRHGSSSPAEFFERRAASDPDAGVIPPGFWNNATLVLPENKQQITLRLDPEVIRFFKRTGKGYQSRMGAVLRSYVEAEEEAGVK